MKLRFSLRALLLAFVCLAAFCWWRQRPRDMADRFIQAVDARQYAAADSLFVNAARPFVVDFMARDDRNRISATRQPQSPGEWLKGVCRMTVELEDFSGLGASIVLQVTTNARGVRNFGFHQSTTALKYPPAPQIRQTIETY